MARYVHLLLAAFMACTAAGCMRPGDRDVARLGLDGEVDRVQCTVRREGWYTVRIDHADGRISETGIGYPAVRQTVLGLRREEGALFALVNDIESALDPLPEDALFVAWSRPPTHRERRAEGGGNRRARSSPAAVVAGFLLAIPRLMVEDFFDGFFDGLFDRKETDRQKEEREALERRKRAAQVERGERYGGEEEDADPQRRRRTRRR